MEFLWNIVTQTVYFILYHALKTLQQHPLELFTVIALMLNLLLEALESIYERVKNIVLG